MTDSVDIDKLQQAFKNSEGEIDLDLFLFYVTWVKNEQNASKAYKELHPSVSDHSSRVLGSVTLAKINKELVMQAYGLDHNLYYTQLKEGIQATKRDQFSGEIAPDHQVRKGYHDKLGKQLGIETSEGNINVQVNVQPILDLKAE